VKLRNKLEEQFIKAKPTVLKRTYFSFEYFLKLHRDDN